MGSIWAPTLGEFNVLPRMCTQLARAHSGDPRRKVRMCTGGRSVRSPRKAACRVGVSVRLWLLVDGSGAGSAPASCLGPGRRERGGDRDPLSAGARQGCPDTVGPRRGGAGSPRAPQCLGGGGARGPHVLAQPGPGSEWAGRGLWGKDLARRGTESGVAPGGIARLSHLPLAVGPKCGQSWGMFLC